MDDRRDSDDEYLDYDDIIDENAIQQVIQIEECGNGEKYADDQSDDALDYETNDHHFTCMDPDIEINTQQETFVAHQGSCFWSDISSTETNNLPQVILTGGEDDFFRVHDALTFQKLYENKHGDSVVSVGFNSNQQYCLSADMAGVINVYKVPVWSNPEFTLETTDLDWCVFHPKIPNIVVAALKNSQIQLWELPSCQYRVLIPGNTHYDEFDGAGSAECAPQISFFRENHVLLAAGYADGSIYIWNIKSGSAVHKFQHNFALKGAITTMAIFGNDVTLVAGCDSSPAIKIFDAINGEFVRELCHYKQKDQSSTEAMVISQTSEYVLSGTIVNCAVAEQPPTGGQLSTWNSTTGALHDIISFKDGITKICLFTINPHWVVAGFLNGSIGVINFLTSEILSFLNPHNGAILSLSFQSHDKVILSSSDDGTVMCLRISDVDVDSTN